MQPHKSRAQAMPAPDAMSGVTQKFEAIFDSLQGVAARIAALMSHIVGTQATDLTRLRLDDEARTRLQHEIVACLNEARWCDGAGYANYSPPAGLQGTDEPLREESGEYWTLEWWALQDGEARPVPLESDQGRQRRVDFRTFDWFREPARRLAAHVDGPYVDYVCNGSYTVTAAHPVIAGDRFAGVGVADILVATIEREISPLLRRLSAPAVIVNPDGRVMISTESSIRPGTLWKAGDNWRIATSTRHPFRLAFLLPAETR